MCTFFAPLTLSDIVSGYFGADRKFGPIRQRVISIYWRFMIDVSIDIKSKYFRFQVCKGIQSVFLVEARKKKFLDAGFVKAVQERTWCILFHETLEFFRII